MNKNKKIYKSALRVVSAVSAVAVLFGIAACSGDENTNIQSLRVETASMKSETAAVSAEHHVFSNKNLIPVTKSGLIELYFDSASYSVSVKETTKGTEWQALPLAPYANGENTAAVFSMKVVQGSNVYYLNSQDNAVAYGSVMHDLTETGIKVSYMISPKKESVAKSSFSADDIVFAVHLDYSVSSGSLEVKCEYENLSPGSNAKIEEIGILEYFGATETAQKNDFLLVPDGCGAIIKTAVEDNELAPLSFNVYGEDYATGQNELALSAIVPAFGIKSGQGAFAAIISKGDAISRIEAQRTGSSSAINRVGAVFTITPVSREEDGEHTKINISSNSYNEEIQLCYRFLTGANATYSGMAAVCREQLIRNRVLSTKTVTEHENLPFNLTLIGAAETPVFTVAGKSFNRMSAITSFEQSLDMLTRMKSKGIDNINTCYTGVLSGGIDQSDISSATLLGKLGGEEGLNSLYEYVKAQNMELYLNVDMLSSGENSKIASEGRAVGLGNAPAFASVKNQVSENIGSEAYKKWLRSPAKLENAVIELLTKFRYMNVTGLCVGDMGSLLYSDYSQSAQNRQTAAAVISEQITSLSTSRRLMTKTGNFYMLKNIDVITDLPSETKIKASEAYVEVPFVQFILHGFADYSGTPVNLSADTKKEMLKAISYGACPSYVWGYSKTGRGREEDDKLYYEVWLNSAVEFYKKANAALADIRETKMYDHYEVEPGVFCTEYYSGTKIYVNFTEGDVETGGFVVKAMDFQRIN